MIRMLRARLAVECVAVTAVIVAAVAAAPLFGATASSVSPGAPPGASQPPHAWTLGTRHAHGPGAVREALTPQNLNPSPRGERGRGVGQLFTLRYASTIDPLPDLRARVVVPAGTARVPIIVLMHGFTLDATSFTDDTYRRFAAAGGGAIVIGVEMRGRGGSSGTPDAGGREIHDIVDAIGAVEKRHGDRVLPDAVHLIGYSGGGANVISAAGRFPDRFASVNAFFPIADYGFDRAFGWWWQCSPRQREKLTEWIGPRDADMAGNAAVGDAGAVAAAYASRAPIFALTNFRSAPLRLFHDRADNNVPPSHTLALQEAAARAGMTNVGVFISDPTDAVRWLHASPNGDAPVRQAEPRMLADIVPTSKIAPPLPRRGRLAIAGYLVTRAFTLWLGDGTSARGWIDYDLDARTFDITYDTLAAPASSNAAPASSKSAATGTPSHEESRAPWTLTLLQQRPRERVSLTINRQPFGGVADQTGALRITRAGH
jgi:pimeloyl-ACP methyl ester carboxylesterase